MYNEMDWDAPVLEVLAILSTESGFIASTFEDAYPFFSTAK